MFKKIFSFFKKSSIYIYNLIVRLIKFIFSKKYLSIPIYIFLAFCLYIIILIKISGDSDFERQLENKSINDVTQLNPMQVDKIVKPTAISQIIKAIKSTTGPISIGGGKYSMGGQTGYNNSLHFDMRSYNQVIKLDTVNKQVTVQPGIRWRELQEYIDPYDLSVKIMQTYANFTVGGAISVNCHGRYIGHGPIISSIIELKIITANGELITANRKENQDVFNSAVGGYGGIGVIVSAKLQLEDNVKVERFTKVLSSCKYNDYFSDNIKNDSTVIFQNGDLYPPDYDEIRSVVWKKTKNELTDTERITSKDNSYWLESNLVELVSWGNTGKWIRRNILDPIVYTQDKIVWRNKEASYDVKELEPSSREEYTYVLQEYFIPVKNINTFTPKMKSIFKKYDVNIINVSLRHALPDYESYLSWANEEVFAYVIYYKQGTDKKARNTVRKWTVEMTDAILSEGGTWYLPYQPHATISQFKLGYPNSDKYFSVKSRLDSNNRFTNKLLDKYNPYSKDSLEIMKHTIRGYFRDEAQTFLTIPEWYLVFNPKEYADYLESNKDPSDFPYYKSIDEYWKLYDRSLSLVSDSYPENDEYITMLQVIGLSVTMEYGLKMIYENTIGWFFSLFSEDTVSPEEKVIAEANRAYSDFIYHTAWYEFDFTEWIDKIWSISEQNNGSFLRKWERTLFFTAEFAVKAGYGKLIEIGAKSSYEEPITNIYAILKTKANITQDNNINTIGTNNDSLLVGITRWGAFTEKLIELSDMEVLIEEIAGNDEIVISYLLKKGKIIEPKELLYSSEVVTDISLTRYVEIIKVQDLLKYIRYLKLNNIEIEHIYDY